MRKFIHTARFASSWVRRPTPRPGCRNQPHTSSPRAAFSMATPQRTGLHQTAMAIFSLRCHARALQPSIESCVLAGRASAPIARCAHHSGLAWCTPIKWARNPRPTPWPRRFHTPPWHGNRPAEIAGLQRSQRALPPFVVHPAMRAPALARLAGLPLCQAAPAPGLGPAPRHLTVWRTRCRRGHLCKSVSQGAPRACEMGRTWPARGRGPSP